MGWYILQCPKLIARASSPLLIVVLLLLSINCCLTSTIEFSNFMSLAKDNPSFFFFSYCTKHKPTIFAWMYWWDFRWVWGSELWSDKLQGQEVLNGCIQLNNKSVSTTANSAAHVLGTGIKESGLFLSPH